MWTTLVDILFGTTMATAGITVGWFWRQRKDRFQLDRGKATIRLADELLGRMRHLAVKMAQDMGEHSSRMGEISRELDDVRSDEAETVVAVVDRLIESNDQMQRRLRDAEERLNEQARQIESHATEARTDALTLLANRRAFDDAIVRALSETQRLGAPLGLIMLDVDHFKTLNDTYGHQTGDDVLRGLGMILRQYSLETDVAARYGGEEFAIVLPGTSPEKTLENAERIRLAVESADLTGREKGTQVTVSMGVAMSKVGETATSLIKRADTALYAAKKAGRNRIYEHKANASTPAEITTLPENALAAAHSHSHPETNIQHADTTRRTTETTEPVADDARSPQSGTQPEACTKTNAIGVSGAVAFDRTQFQPLLDMKIAAWKRGGTSPCVMLIHIDNQNLPRKYSTGAVLDLMRQATAQFLNATLRDMDFLSQYDPTTFAAVLPETSVTDATTVGERLRAAVETSQLTVDNRPLRFTVSIGVSQAADGDDAASLMEHVEDARHAAEAAGGNQLYLHDGEVCQSAAPLLELLG